METESKMSQKIIVAHKFAIPLQKRCFSQNKTATFRMYTGDLFLTVCELCFTHVTVFQYYVSVDP